MNQKIERVITEIGKTKDKIAGLQTKLRAQEQQKIALENDEIIALFRKEKLNEDDLIALVKSKRESEQNAGDDSLASFGERQDSSPANQSAILPGKEKSDNES